MKAKTRKNNSKGNMMLAGIVAVIVIVAGLGVLYYSTPSGPATQSDVKTFASEAEVKDFLKSQQEASGYFGNFYARAQTLEATADSGAAGGAPTAAPAVTGQKASDYSTTNVQIAGVDEADYVKNDGEYIYTISGSQVVIVDANPAADMQIVSTINLSQRNPSQIYINGDRLVVIGTEYTTYPYPIPLDEPITTDIGGGIGSSGSAESGMAVPGSEEVEEMVVSEESPKQTVAAPDAGIAAESRIAIWPPYYSEPLTYIDVYDVTDRANPDLVKSTQLNGSYTNSRMIGDHVYTILTVYPRYYGGDIIIPMFSPSQRAFPEVYYFDVPDYNYQFTNVVSLNVKDGSNEVKNKVFMTGYSSNLFVSENNIYLVYQKQVKQSVLQDKILDEVLLPIAPQSVRDETAAIRASDKSEFRKLGEVQLVIQEWQQSLTPAEYQQINENLQKDYQRVYEEVERMRDRSVIHKISISNGDIEYKAEGEVPGTPLNQFSMDESNGYFRIATTTSQWREDQKNNVYVLDSGMNTVGKIEGLAPGERIYSARFIGDRAYLVTFVQVDPLFVIDLSDPTQPKVLGELKIPGVSTYLHPYDENHIIGIGQSTEEIKDRVTFKGIKLALFDVSDVANPIEIAKYEIGERGTSSEALYDHKAFLFSKSNGLLVLPVMLVEKEDPTRWFEPTWQGAYVFTLTPENGFELKGKVTHSDLVDTTDYPYYYYGGPYSISRSLYMDDTLYTLSQKAIKANSLTDLTEISTVELPGWEELWYGIKPLIAETGVAVR